MKNKFLFLTKDSLKNKIKTKAFLTVNILLCVLLVCLVNLDSLIKLFGGDFNKPINIYVVDEANVYDEVEAVMNQSVFGLMENYNATPVKAEKSLEELKKEIKEEESDHIILHITLNENPTVKEITETSNVLTKNINTEVILVKKNEEGEVA